MNISGLKDLNEKKIEELLYFWSLSGVLEVKDDHAGMENKKQQIFMHWNVAPDALPGSYKACTYFGND